MKENDNAFISAVVDFYYSTIDDDHTQGNMSKVADKFGITRAKVNKILITAGVIDSPLHQDIMKLKSSGLNNTDIASKLGVSITTVKINIPYEKVIYNGETKSVGANYVKQFRNREKIFLNNVVSKKIDIGHIKEKEDDKFNVMLLHIELDDDLSIVKDLASIKYPRIDKDGYTISRDVIVPDNIPLHNLHYVINQAFGFANSHLHEYTLSDNDLRWITDGKVSNWKKYVGLVFKNPIRDENIDFWDDDYNGGSPKKWMRSKYTGPSYTKIYEESYSYVQEQIKNLIVKSKTIDDLKLEFFLNAVAINEALPVKQVLSFDGHKQYKSIEEYSGCMKQCFEDVNCISRPFVYSLNYNYDFGDNWNFTIRVMKDADYLVKDKRINRNQIKEAINEVYINARPIVIAADGLPLIEDVGGVYGYIDFLKGINGLDSEMYEDKKDYLIWAKNNGWPGKIGNLRTLL